MGKEQLRIHLKRMARTVLPVRIRVHPQPEQFHTKKESIMEQAEGYSGDVSVAVVIQEHTIKAILVTETSDDEAFFNRAMDVVKNVLKNQNTDVDTVSGATYSSKGLLGAIKNALKQAEKVTNGESIEEKADTTELENAVKSAEDL